MGLRFQKRIRLIKGLTINFRKSGASISLGGKGATINISKRGTKTTVGLPGSGISYSKFEPRKSTPALPHNDPEPNIESSQKIDAPAGNTSPVLIIVSLVLIIGVLISRYF